MTPAELTNWLEAHWLALLVGAILAAATYRYARPLVHRLVRRAVRPVAIADMDPAIAAEEAAKRAATIEDLLAGLLRFVVVVAVILAVLTLLDLLPVLAGLAVVAAALTLAGQSIVLDYLMGLLILAEGQYYKGDWIAVGAVEGTVEEVGIRRTIVRDGTGTVHSISNGTIRVASNLTRVYANLQVDVTISELGQVDRATAVIDEVGSAMAADPAWREALLEPPRCIQVLPLTEAGVGLRAGARIRATDRWSAPSEFRRRLVIALAQEGIATSANPRSSAPTDRPPGGG